MEKWNWWWHTIFCCMLHYLAERHWRTCWNGLKKWSGMNERKWNQLDTLDLPATWLRAKSLSWASFKTCSSEECVVQTLTLTHTHTSENGILRHGFDIILECLPSPFKLCFTEGNSVVVVVVVVDVVVAVEDMVIIFFSFSMHIMHTHNKNSYFFNSFLRQFYCCC